MKLKLFSTILLMVAFVSTIGVGTAADSEILTMTDTMTVSAEFATMTTSVFSSASSYSAVNAPTLKDGNAVEWIDRIDSLPEYATDLYAWLAVNSSVDGALVDVSEAEYISQGSNEGSYVYTLGWKYPDSYTVSGDFTFNAGATQRDIQNAAWAAFEAQDSADLSDEFSEIALFTFAVFNAFDRDFPEVFWLDGTASVFGEYSMYMEYDKSSRTGTYYVEPVAYLLLKSDDYDIRAAQYRTVSGIETAMAGMEADMDTIFEDMPSDASRYEQIKYLNKWLTEHNEYNRSYNLNYIPHDTRECISALDGRYGTDGPVCEAYARAFKVLCDVLEIPCVLVDGDAKGSPSSEGEPHMWNYVQMEDGYWYAVDVTWDDPLGGNSGVLSGIENEDWLLVGSDTEIEGMAFIDSHPVSNTVSENGLAFVNGPELSADRYTFTGGGAGDPDDEFGDSNVVATGYCGGEGDGTNLTWTLYDNGSLVISGTGAMADYEYGVTPWASPEYTLTSLTIENNVTTIGNAAFAGCVGFKGPLTIPNSVTSIGNFAFASCVGFKSLTLSENLISIGKNVFQGCYALSGALIIPDSVTTIGVSAFTGCPGLTSLVLSDNLTTIPDNTFSGCYGFTGELLIPNGVTSIGSSAFSGCRGFTGSLVIPDSVTAMGRSAFSGCSGFNGTLVLSDNLTAIEYDTFGGCYSFTGELVIPDGITSIGYYAFDGCRGFTGELSIPDSVTTIEDNAFSGCSGFTGALHLPNNIAVIDNYVFFNCTGLSCSLVIPSTVTLIEDRAFRNTGINEILFQGNAPAVESDMFNPNTVLYYTEGTTGWTDSEYYDAEAETWHGYTLKLYSTDASYTVSGTVTSYLLAEGDMTVELLNGDMETVYSTTVNTYVGVDVFTSSYSIEGVADGSYTLRVNKAGHAVYTVDVVVNGNSLQQDVVLSLLGDLDEDGEVSDWDAILLNRWLAGWGVTLSEAVADVDKDGEVSDWDAIVLERYLAGWSITLS